MTNASASIASRDETEILSWTVHLAAADKTKLVVTILVILAASASAWVIIGPVGSVAVVLALTGSVAEFVFPVKYRITTTKVVCSTIFKTTEIEWSRVRNCFLDESGIKLSTVCSRSKLEAFRGMYLRFNGNREQVIEAVKLARNQCP
ncbi:MAG: hypothetical protein QHI38_02300 [Armatimonadota bacterium]|nr:hypothetical protein [Armatimonadota bacterium]